MVAVAYAGADMPDTMAVVEDTLNTAEAVVEEEYAEQPGPYSVETMEASKKMMARMVAPGFQQPTFERLEHRIPDKNEHQRPQSHRIHSSSYTTPPCRVNYMVANIIASGL
jgi:hypothetical protein